jgi:hypothetical protein
MFNIQGQPGLQSKIEHVGVTVMFKTYIWAVPDLNFDQVAGYPDSGFLSSSSF